MHRTGSHITRHRMAENFESRNMLDRPFQLSSERKLPGPVCSRGDHQSQDVPRESHTSETHDTCTSWCVTMAWSPGRAIGTSPRYWPRTRLPAAHLPADQASGFKNRCIGNLFIALDRPDVQFASKENSRSVAQPTIDGDETLREPARNLTAPRLLRCPRQPMPSKTVGLNDAHWAAGLVTWEQVAHT